ncbi:unnamed protein product [Boreogadus saida]
MHPELHIDKTRRSQSVGSASRSPRRVTRISFPSASTRRSELQEFYDFLLFSSPPPGSLSPPASRRFSARLFRSWEPVVSSMAAPVSLHGMQFISSDFPAAAPHALPRTS